MGTLGRVRGGGDKLGGASWGWGQVGGVELGVYEVVGGVQVGDESRGVDVGSSRHGFGVGSFLVGGVKRVRGCT